MLNSPVSKRDHTIGPWNAKVVMVEYSDFECPYCAAAEPVFRALRETLSDSLLFAYRHFPPGCRSTSIEVTSPRSPAHQRVISSGVVHAR